MKTKEKNLALFLCLVLGIAFLPEIAFSQKKAQENLLRYAWKAVRGARGYIFQVRDVNGKMLLSRRTGKNRIDFDLPPGEYRFRLAALNKFYKISRWTNWETLWIKRSHLPVVITGSNKPVVLQKPSVGQAGKNGTVKGPAIQSIVIKGAHFTKKTRVRLVRKDGTEIKTSHAIKNGKTIVLKVNSRKIKKGTYDLVVENPGKKVIRRRAFLTLVDKPKTDPGKKDVAGKTGKKDPDKKDVAGKTGKKDPGKKDVAGKTGKKDPGKKDVAGKTGKKDPGKKDVAGKTGKKSHSGKTAYVKKPEKKAEPPVPASRKWKAFVPGLNSFSRGDSWKGMFWAGVFTGYAWGGAWQWSQANKVSRQAEKLPLNNIANILLYTNLPNITSEQMAMLGWHTHSELQRLNARYRQFRANQGYIGGAALLTYLLHSHSESLSRFKWEQLVPGLPNFKQGSRLAGSLWVGTFLALAAGGYSEYSKANSISRNTKSDFLTSIYSDPLLYTTVLNKPLDQAALSDMFMMSALLKSSPEAKYRKHRRNQAVIGGAAAALYIVHLLFAGSSSPDVPRKSSPAGGGPAVTGGGGPIAAPFIAPQAKGGTMYGLSLHYRF